MGAHSKKMLLKSTLVLSLATLALASDTCWSEDDEYTGPKARTASGKKCVKWPGWPSNSRCDGCGPVCRRVTGGRHGRAMSDDGPWCFTRRKWRTYNNWEKGSCGIPKCVDQNPTTEKPYKNGEPECGKKPFDPTNTNIMGGINAGRGEWGWQIALRQNGRGYCGGSILNKDWVVTAAHCVPQHKRRNVNIAVGWHHTYGSTPQQTNDSSSSFKHGQDYIPVSKIIVHEDYDAYTISNDIALIKLSKSINYPKRGQKTYVRPICLPEQSFSDALVKVQSENTDDFTFCSITGFGKTLGTELPGASRKYLMEADVPLTTNKFCTRKDGGYKKSEIIDSMICADSGDENDHVDACQGDSGGPLVCDAKPVGRKKFESKVCADGNHFMG